MAVNVYTPQKRYQTTQTAAEANPLARLLTVGGLMAGGLTANPGAALAGASTGAALGNLAGGLLGGGKEAAVKQTEVAPSPEPVQSGDTMRRQLGSLDQSQANIKQITASIDSLKYVQDEDLRMKLAQPLLQAYDVAGKQV